MSDQVILPRDTNFAEKHDQDESLNIAPPKPEQVQDDPSETPPRDLKGYKWIICVLAIFSSVFLYALDNTIVATIQPAIIQSLGELDKLPWVSVAYQVTSVASDLTWYISRSVHTAHSYPC
jgi:hypothetical protein